MRKCFSYIGAIVVLLIVITPLFFTTKKSRVESITIQCDTIVIRDTIRDTVPRYKERYITRIDTVFLSSPDTLQEKHEVIIPIERKEYKENDYHAIIEGYNPSLVYMEVYRNTKYITQTKYIRENSKNRYGIGLQVGYGGSKDGLSPYIGIGFQYNIFGW